MSPAAGGDHPPRPPWTGEVGNGWKHGRSRECVGEAGIWPASLERSDGIAGQIPASQARRPFGASLKEFNFESLLKTS